MTHNTIRITILTFLCASTAAFAQQKMDDMKGMDMSKMESMEMGKKPAGSKPVTHVVKATVKKVDQSAHTVTLAHEPVASLSWPAMTMNFKVKDEMLLKKLSIDQRVDVKFVKEGEDYVVTSVK